MKVVEREIGIGDGAVRKTVPEMCRLARRDAANARVVELARRLKRGRSDRDAVRAALRYVVETIRFKPDPPNVEWVTAPIHTLFGAVPTGDCDCMCTALAALLLSMGFSTRFRVIAHSGRRQYSHVDMDVRMPDGSRIVLDPVLEQSTGNGFDNVLQKPTVVRQEYFSCKPEAGMKLVTLEGLGNCPSCGTRCGGTCGARRSSSCCGGGHGAGHMPSGGIVVNVNTGSQSTTTDASSRSSWAGWWHKQFSGSSRGSAPAGASRGAQRAVPTPAAPVEFADDAESPGVIRSTARVKREHFMEFL